MEHTKVPSELKTFLPDRILWYDGDSSYPARSLAKIIRSRNVQYVDKITADVREYNRHVKKEEELTLKSECKPLSTEWQIPDEYKQMNVRERLVQIHSALHIGCDPSEFHLREQRLVEEIDLFEQLQLFDVLRAITWIINKLSAANCVWGVGRGSSVSSYVLYVIGVHDVDSFAYDLDINDFLHDQ